MLVGHVPKWDRNIKTLCGLLLGFIAEFKRGDSVLMLSNEPWDEAEAVQTLQVFTDRTPVSTEPLRDWLNDLKQ